MDFIEQDPHTQEVRADHEASRAGQHLPSRVLREDEHPPLPEADRREDRRVHVFRAEKQEESGGLRGPFRQREHHVVYTNIGDVPLPALHRPRQGPAGIPDPRADRGARSRTIFPRFTEHTIVDRARLIEELRKIREIRLLVRPGGEGAGGTLRGGARLQQQEEVIGAIGISGMIQNMTTERMEAHAQVIKSVAEKVSINVGNDLLF